VLAADRLGSRLDSAKDRQWVDGD